jgi:DinB family protein
MRDQSLLILIKDIRGKTLRILDNVTEDQARFAPPGLQNTILWHAGHALVVVEHLAASPASGKPPAYPEDWFEKFNWKSQPATVKQWPTLADVKTKLIDQRDRLLAAVEKLTEQQLSQAPNAADPSRILRWSIIHGLHDEANHQGEMWLLKKLQTAGK